MSAYRAVVFLRRGVLKMRKNIGMIVKVAFLQQDGF